MLRFKINGMLQVSILHNAQVKPKSRSGAHPASYSMSTGASSARSTVVVAWCWPHQEWSAQVMKLITPLHAMPRLQISDSTPLLRLYAFMVLAGTFQLFFVQNSCTNEGNNWYKRKWKQFLWYLTFSENRVVTHTQSSRMWLHIVWQRDTNVSKECAVSIFR